ncbi:MAG TPA: hypothetical protein VMY99_00515 [Nevskiaceae bacterium]|nr:hypothetical protein [Nevskiaceae bacterium]
MNPEQYPNGQNPYDFILNAGKPPKRSPMASASGGSPLVKIALLVGGGAVVLMIVLFIGISLLSGSNSSTLSSTELISVAQTQNELARVAEKGLSGSSQQTVKNLAITVELSMQTQQKQLIALLGKQGHKVKEKELALKQNATTDQQLTSATQTSTFDTTFSQIMQNQLTAYAATVKQLFNKATLESERTLLSDDYTQAQLLLSQVPSAESLKGE